MVRPGASLGDPQVAAAAAEPRRSTARDGAAARAGAARLSRAYGICPARPPASSKGWIRSFGAPAPASAPGRASGPPGWGPPVPTEHPVQDRRRAPPATCCRRAEKAVDRAHGRAGHVSHRVGDHPHDRSPVVRGEHDRHEGQRRCRHRPLHHRHLQHQPLHPLGLLRGGEQAHVGAERQPTEHRAARTPEVVEQAEHLRRRSCRCGTPTYGSACRCGRGPAGRQRQIL